MSENHTLNAFIRILVVDNERPHAEIVATALSRVGYTTDVATSGEKAVQKMESEIYDIIFTDLVMDGVDGFGVLSHASETLPEAEVILMTGHGSVPSAVTAMQQGAFNYLLKPLDLSQLRAVAQKAADAIRLRRENTDLHTRLDEKFGFETLVGESPQMIGLVERLRRISPTNATVLIQGPTGTGKELVAQAIHQNSPRKNKPFVGLNCAALSENILESELFGHVKGAFTDATSDRLGKFEYASGGTLFLDEVGDMPMPTQIKLLRVLEEGEITRVGSNLPIKVNVRLLSATNRDLAAAVHEGTFRSDLYHRLKVISVRLPALKERTGDIPVLMDYFMRFFAKKHGKTLRGMSAAARRTFLAYDWPGNVRELRNVIESMIVVDYDALLDIDDLPEELESYVPAGAVAYSVQAGRTASVSEEDSSGSTLSTDASENVSSKSAVSFSDASEALTSLVGQPLEEIERLFITETLAFTGGNREEAARMLGISERTLYRKIKEMQKKTQQE
ncbi:MAG: sigma-54 dependent transcriptional regulator [Planctomycetia bacterium]|nr:sigma-54 dependent transcriptional regulator [Planctomycetia bacterium]